MIRRKVAVVFAVMVLVVVQMFSPVYSECADNADCPAGMTCINGLCSYPVGTQLTPEPAAQPQAGDDAYSEPVLQTGYGTALVQQVPGCTRDIDCKGNRICRNGECVDPEPAPQAVSQQVSGCTKDTYCKSDRICRNGKCVSPNTDVVTQAGSCSEDGDCGSGYRYEGGICRKTGVIVDSVTAPAVARGMGRRVFFVLSGGFNFNWGAGEDYRDVLDDVDGKVETLWGFNTGAGMRIKFN